MINTISNHDELIEPFTVFLCDFILVCDPVLVPTPDGCRVMNTQNINVLDFKSGRFKL
jgi:hypothetical protein